MFSENFNNIVNHFLPSKMFTSRWNSKYSFAEQNNLKKTIFMAYCSEHSTQYDMKKKCIQKILIGKINVTGSSSVSFKKITSTSTLYGDRG